MKFQYLLNTMFFALILLYVTTNCIANDNLLLVIQVDYDNCVMTLYQDSPKADLDKNKIIAKTYCAITNNLEQDNESLKYNIFFKYTRPLIKVGLQNLLTQSKDTKKYSANYFAIENLVASFYNNENIKDPIAIKTNHIQNKEVFTNILKQLLVENRIFVNRKITVVKNTDLLTQAGLEYFYNTEIDKSKVDKLLISNMYIEPQNIEVITNKLTKKNMNFISAVNTSKPKHKTKERNIFYKISEEGLFSNKPNHSGKKPYNENLVLLNDTILQYKLYKLSSTSNLDSLITNENLTYYSKAKIKNEYNTNQDKITDFITINVNSIHEIFSKNKIDYIVLMGNALLNNIVRNIYFKQLEQIQPNLPSDRVYIINNEEFYFYLIAAAKTILLQQNNNIEYNFEPSSWEYSANNDALLTNKVKIDNSMTKKMRSLVDENETNNFDYNYADHDYQY